MNTDWFKADDFTEVEDVNVHPNVSIFNRKLYTFGNKGETYIKFSYINSCIQSQDEITLLDTRSCVFKISDTRFIVVLKKDENYAVIGELGNRYITKNKLCEYDVQIRSPDDYTIIPMSEIYDPSKLDFELLYENAGARVKNRFDAYMKDIRNN
ncbi:hypothetical protein JA9_003723 [Meyerozyma sp. JA9]|nr:hypothetical protein JA9_003723 [Meyerozyma sp. JA9]